MAQHDFSIEDGSGLDVLQNTSAALVALASLSKGATAPSSPVLGQWWLSDAATPWVLNQYVGASVWLPWARVDPSSGALTLLGIVEAASAVVTGRLIAGAGSASWRGGQHAIVDQSGVGSVLGLFSGGGAGTYSRAEWVQGDGSATGTSLGFAGSGVFGGGDEANFGIGSTQSLHLGSTGTKRAEFDTAGRFNVNSTTGRGRITVRGTGDSYSLALEDPSLSGHVGLRITGGSGSENLSIYVNDTPVCYAEAGAFRPATSNAVSCGSLSGLWSELFAGNTTVNSSDGQLKRLRNSDAARGTVPGGADLNGAGLSEAERRAFLSVQIVAYQMWDAIDKKGDAARIHVGPVTQAVADLFEAEGLDVRAYSFWCEDPLTEEVEEAYTVEVQATDPVEITRQVIEVVDGQAVQRQVTEVVEQPRFEALPVVTENGTPVLDANGQPRTVDAPVMIAEQQTRIVPRPVLDENGQPRTTQGIRAAQLLYGIMEALRSTVAAHEARLVALEGAG